MITNNKEILSVGGGSYESPVISVVELESEGVLCASFEEYNEDTLYW